MQAPKYNFCPQCGNKLEIKIISNREREFCPHCSFVHWGEFCLGVGGVVWRGDKVLLVQRAYSPGKGLWTIPGGYVDQNEEIAGAVSREIQEETNIQAKPKSIIALRDRPGTRHDTYIVFLLEDLGGEPAGQPEEVSDLGFFTLEECKKLDVAPLTLSVIKASLSQASGFQPVENIKLIGSSLAKLYQISNNV